LPGKVTGKRGKSMSDEIGLGGDGESRVESGRTSQLVPMRVGNATVFVEQVGRPAEIQTDDAIYPVSPLSPEDAFEKAGQILQECVRVVGERVAELAGRARPRDIMVEFTLSFEVGGKAQLIPVLFTGETKAVTGLKVTAVWAPQSEGS
jgi:hypothetical protein